MDAGPTPKLYSEKKKKKKRSGSIAGKGYPSSRELCAQGLEVRNSAGYAGASGSPGTKFRVIVEEIMLERGEGPVLTASR